MDNQPAKTPSSGQRNGRRNMRERATAYAQGGRPGRYSALGLLSHGFSQQGWPWAWRSVELGPAYDVVIIGAGVHGLATAYYLGPAWDRNVAVLDKGYIGGGGSGRNTAIVRSNYLTLRASGSTTARSTLPRFRPSSTST